MELHEGMAVAVPFGRKNEKFYAGIVWRLHTTPPATPHIKRVARILYGGRILIDARQRALWEWVADYYLSTLGEVMRIALPALMKPAERDMSAFVEAEYHPRTERYLKPLIKQESEGEELQKLDKLERRAPKQYAALMALLERAAESDDGWVPRRLSEAEPELLRTLERKGLIAITEREPKRTESRGEGFLLPLLSGEQQRALEELEQAFRKQPCALLHGITGSGKTEIYIHLIAKTLARGEDVLMLIPEIALTTQLTERLERIFSSRVTPYHSKLSPQRRTETYLRLSRSAGGEFVVGARSALFLPLKRPGLIIVDEEHDTSYKQSDPAPRYQARDCAIQAAHLYGCHTLLGSATPSLESWLQAQSGRYGLATLNERYGGVELPRIILSDTMRSVKRGERKSHFNLELRERIARALECREQVLLFQNRRGFSPFVLCPSCGWSASCPHCHVTLTYHKRRGRLSCHYCGHAIPMVEQCPHCGHTEIDPAGFGTEKVEEEIARLFPEARILRMDRDTVTTERAYRQTIEKFEQGEADILIGTQMVTKGFDFGRLSLVGVLNADNLLLNPDFRSTERAFQLLSQVAGRAGRRGVQGEVVIQCTDTTHPLMGYICRHDYEGMARELLAERELFNYPPYARIVRFTMRHTDRELLHRSALELASMLRERFGRRLLGPATPAVERIREEWLCELLLKIERGAPMSRARAIIRQVCDRFKQGDGRKITLVIDVDAQ